MRFIPFLPAEYTGPARQVILGVLLVLLMLYRPRAWPGGTDYDRRRFACGSRIPRQAPDPDTNAAAPESAPATPPALETVGISKHFGAVHAVDQLSIAIPRQGGHQHCRPQRFRQVNPGQPPERVLPLDGGLVIIDGVGLRVVKACETPAHGLTRTFQRCVFSTR